MARVFGDRWEIVESLGEGGQGYIFKVRDLTSDGRDLYVLKRLKNPARVDRCQKEIEACRKLQHPGIAPVLDYSLGDPAYFVTNLYDGNPLSAYEGRQDLPSLKALDLFISLCGIAMHAHDNNIVHRDIKPGNIFVTKENAVVVLDFGLCYSLDGEDRLTATMEQVGSRFYMAPELEAGRSDGVSAAVDAYALGKVLYFMLTGCNLAREDFGGSKDPSCLRGEAQLKYVTDRILARTIVEDPNQRASVAEIKEAAVRIKRLIAEHYYPGLEGSQCRFCGEGIYKLEESPGGLRMHRRQSVSVGTEYFIMLVCDNCSNVQWFRAKK